MADENDEGRFEAILVAALNPIRQSLAQIEAAVCKNAPRSVDRSQAYTRQEAARILRVSLWTIDRARKNGLLVETRRLGERDVRLTGESLAAFQRERQGGVKVKRL